MSVFLVADYSLNPVALDSGARRMCCEGLLGRVESLARSSCCAWVCSLDHALVL
jgi:hypothetical protein